ncbi:hypothetical protein GQF01_20475 [Paenibacillus sp. 5J-6]|uniref:Uncharacterized protein n=1 Tax=Paenibacillus silvestris TaxID=2606219 RepID=A0A6L8V212_9BACL|nr:hypothetical protein [Paenibacillus silvestris]MZQ84483.1 hypothetical protein [Paenibacillus silvestris]
MHQSKIWCAVSSFLVADGRFASYNKYGLRIQDRVGRGFHILYRGSDGFRNPGKRFSQRGIAVIATRKKWAGGIVKQARIDAVKQFSWQAEAQSLADFYRLKLEERHEKSGKETDES